MASGPNLEQVHADQLRRVLNFFRYRVGNAAAAEALTARTMENAGRLRYGSRLEIAEFSTWLLTIARSVAIEHLRACPRHYPRDVALSVPSSLALGDQRAASVPPRLAELMAALPPRQRELIAMKFGAEMTDRAIARATGLRESTVGAILHRAVETLRERRCRTALSGAEPDR